MFWHLIKARPPSATVKIKRAPIRMMVRPKTHNGLKNPKPCKKVFDSPFGEICVICNAKKIPIPPSRRSKFFLVPLTTGQKILVPPDAGSKKVVPPKSLRPPGRKLWTLPNGMYLIIAYKMKMARF